MPKNPKSKISNPKSKKAYAAASVDVGLGNRVKRGIQSLVKGTHGLEVLGRILLLNARRRFVTSPA